MKRLRAARVRLLLAEAAGRSALRMRLFLLVIALMLAAALGGGATPVGGGGSDMYPRFQCGHAWVKPRIRCEAFHITNQAPRWEVSSAGAVREHDEGRVVFLTIPATGEWSLIEMSFVGNGGKRVRVAAWARWRGFFPQFQRYVSQAEPCGNDKPCA